jgi:hypothetical protein
MSKTITWVRPSGTEITTNGSVQTVAYAAGMGWKPKGETAPAAVAPAAAAPKPAMLKVAKNSH